MLLPCKHIFALRKHLGLSLFDKEIVNKRWTLEYYKSKQRVFITRELDIPDINNDINDKMEIDYDITINTASNIKPQTYAQKRRKTLFVNDSLAALMGQSCEDIIPSTSNAKECKELNINDIEIIFCNENDDTEDISISQQSVPKTETLKPNINILQDITLPKVIKRRGRPKGAELTVIGIPKRNKRLGD
ncbi:hypothetical protein ABEB36_013866 [Hypothenemus hampei]|uniref:Uncharacterized protein n=1 Tax=Hypothenemus hampei TaxID=57062 RepID=A0ABD1E5I3_HYPHA